MKTFKQYLTESVKILKPTGWGVKKPGKQVLRVSELKIEQIILVDVKAPFSRWVGGDTDISIMTGKYVLIYAGWYSSQKPGSSSDHLAFNIIHPITHKNLTPSIIFSFKQSEFYFPK